MKRKTLTINFIFNLINQLLMVLLPLITAPYVARVLGSVGNGQYSYAYSVVQYFVVFSSLGFASYGQRETARCNNDIKRESKLFWEIVILRSMPTLFSFVLFLVLGFSNSLNIMDSLLMVSVSLNILSVGFDITFFYQGLEEFKMIAIRTIIIRIVLIVMIFLFVKSAGDVWIYALCTAGSTLGANLLMWFGLRKRLCKIRINELEYKKHIKPVMLLFVPNIAITLYTVLDKTMINLLTNGTQEFKDYSNGCYEQAYKINSLSLIFVTVISPIFQSRNSTLFIDGKYDQLRKNINFAIDYVWRVSLPMIAGFVVLSSNLTSWFYGPGYDDVPILMIIMSVRFIFSGFYEVFATQLLLVLGKEKYISLATWIAALINVSLNLVLIPYFGAIGAAIATAICEFFNFMLVFILSIRFKYFNIKHFFVSFLKPFLSSMLMFLAIYFAQYYRNYSIFSFLIIVLLGIFTYGIVLLILKDKFSLFVVCRIFNIIKKVFCSLRRKKQ